jgi:stage II sporulation protein D
MLMWTSRSTEPAKRFARRTHNAALAAALLIGACAPVVPGPVGPEPTPAPGPGLPRAEPAVRVGIAVDTATVELGSSAGLRLESADGRVLARVPAAEQVVFRLAADGTAEYELRPAGTRQTGLQLPVVVRAEGGGTLNIGQTAYRGVVLVQRGARAGLTAVNQLEMETYLLGVVPREIGRVGDDLLEAAKAQAVAARTYAVAYIGRREALGFDVFATVQDQVYGGVPAEHEPVSRAVHQTRGEILIHGGAPIEAYYHSTCAGQTAAIEEVWNAGPRPYLRSVLDVNPATGEAFDITSNRFRWTERWTVEELTRTLNRTLADSLPRGVASIGELRDIAVLEHTHSGRVGRLRIEASNASFDLGGDRVRWILVPTDKPLLNSAKFGVELVRDDAGRIREVLVHGGGWGHGIGMCQVGAMGRNRAGQDYRQILRAYYQGAELRRLY